MDFTQKYRWVKNGHLTPDLDDSKYAGVVYHENVRIALNYDDLHQNQVLAVEIINAHLQDPTSEKHYIIFGIEF